ncbi:MAG TPA: hypothetical protein VF665_07215 [Longimicrobium sp.]|jgi:hypothetical protein|uniref:hypothetical protein n=1 Tax=Longimicrobium sp. TaxID=2029185 RepID=UPI002ED789EE
MLKKLRLDVEQLAVDTFAASDGLGVRRGTVRAAQDDCTNWNSCLCVTAYYWCVEYNYTDYSCEGGSGYPTERACREP